MYVFTYVCTYVYMYVCMHVCMYVAQLVRVCSWRLKTSVTFGSEFECGRATYIRSLGQGTNIQLPLSPECLSPECQVLSKKQKRSYI